MPKNGIYYSRAGFKCAYCEKKRKGPYRWVDGYRSCEECNRRYDPPKAPKVTCPLCKGAGALADTIKNISISITE